MASFSEETMSYMSEGTTMTGIEVSKRFAKAMQGKTYVITGPSQGGFGAEVAISLAHGAPARLFLAGRSFDKISSVIDAIKQVNKTTEVIYVPLDLLDNSSVREAAQQIQSATSVIHALINNAGVMGRRDFCLSQDGIESQFAANHIGHFLLSNLLMPQLVQGSATIVNVASRGYLMSEVNFEDLNFEQGKSYNGWVAYGQSKTANILFTVALAQRNAGTAVSTFAVHPGVSIETKLLSNSNVTEEWFLEAYELMLERNEGKPLPEMRTVTATGGAAHILELLLEPSFQEHSGKYLEEGRVVEAKTYATDESNAGKLWALSERLVGQEFPAPLTIKAHYEGICASRELPLNMPYR